jgi:photosystem II stability/assembly factor-like uncharacterized protein
MRWRAIGPYRGGRTKAVAGVPGQPHTFYIGVCNGGVWKTTDAGRTWQPIFDDQPTGSIGWVEVAPSDPNVIYVGSGEGLQRPDLSTGDGIYKSTDAGRTWTHLGLRDGQQIPKIAVDPRNPNRLFVAVLGHPYGPNTERGIFRSTDGGRTFEKVFYKDENTGGKDVDIDPSNPDIVYATMWESQQGPWENAAWGGTGGGVFKSTDGGATWKPLTKGLPENLAQAELAIAPSNTSRLYATVGVRSAGGAGGGRGATGGRGAGAGRGGAGGVNRTGIYRSDDAGETWTQTTADARPASRIDEAVPIVDPKNADTVYIATIVTWKSTDGGRTFVPFKGAPGGDDYQAAWINPNDPDIMLLVADQGAVVTLNGGQTWSSWYNQPTAQMYHVMADNAFPYRVCSGQQESGSACVASRGNDGEITFREWHPVGVEEYGYAAPDPLDPDIVYGGKVSRYDRRTGQVSNVGPVEGRGGGPGGAPGTPSYRTVRTQPVVFSPVDPHALFYANNVLWKTVDGGITWKQISPDLTRKSWTPPKSIGKYVEDPSAQSRQLGVIYTIGPSYRDIDRIWVGTDDGLIQTTSDGGLHWTDVTPPQMSPFMKVFMIDPGRFDALTAYAAVNTLRIDDMRPHIYRTHDGGRTWTEIVNGLPDGAAASVVREDPKKKGLLFAGTETQVYVSFDDGDHWQSLRLNMAPSSVRDLIVKDDDVVAATHGRGFWILDDITPLRQIDAKTADEEAVLFEPTTALRVRWNTNTDTPLPPDEPAAPNPPEGAIIDYYLKSPAQGPVTLEIFERGASAAQAGTSGRPSSVSAPGALGRLVRRYSSDDRVVPIPEPSNAPVPLYWYRPPQALSAAAGMHRFTWDVHYQPLAGGGGGRGGLPIAAVPYNTVPAPSTPWVAPGTYVVKLTVNGKSHTQPITVKADPRVKTPLPVMQQVYALTKAMYFGAADAQAAAAKLAAIRTQVADRQTHAKGAAAQALADFDKKAEALQGAAAAGGRGAGAGGRGAGPGGRAGVAAGATGPAAAAGAAAETLSAASAALAGVVNSLQGADVRPTAVQLRVIASARQTAARAMARWKVLEGPALAALNATLKAAGLQAITSAQ